jgi:transcription initiation factor TFIIIB Brf1 subunit/transcription initiation factor TFIIB
MTELLEKAFSEASKLSSEEQDKFATWMLDELASEQRWESAFSNSDNALAELANESRTTERFRRAFTGLPEDVQRQARQAYRRFREDPYYPGLRFRQVHPTLPVYSARISINYRALGILEGEDIIWFWIGSHSDYDNLLAQL